MSQRPRRRLFHRAPVHRDLSHVALLALLALVALWLQGCAQTQPLAAPPPWPLDDPAPVYEVEPPQPSAGPDASLNAEPGVGLGGRIAPPAPTTERLLALALQEWELWGRGRWDAATRLTEHRLDTPRRQEAEPYLHARVLLYSDEDPTHALGTPIVFTADLEPDMLPHTRRELELKLAADRPTLADMQKRDA